MTIIKNIIMDLENSGKFNRLLFSEGSYLRENAIINVEPCVIPLDLTLYDDFSQHNVFFNAFTGQYSIREGNIDPCWSEIHLGGFIVRGCEIRLLLPTCINGDYSQGFGSGFDLGYNRDSDECSPPSPPVITLNGPNPQEVEFNSEYIEQGASAVDYNNQLVPVVISGTVDTSIVATYQIQYTATDSFNSSTVNRIVNVYSN